MMNVREALETRPWFRTPFAWRRDAAVEDIDRALRAQWLAGYHAAIPTSDPEPTLTAGVAAMTEGP